MPEILFVASIYILKILNYYRKDKKSNENVLQNEKVERKKCLLNKRIDN